MPNDVTGLRGLVGAVGAEAGKEGGGTAMLGSMEPYAIAAGLSAVHQTLRGHHYLRHVNESYATGENTSV